MSEHLETLRRALRAGRGLVWIQGEDDARLLQGLRDLCAERGLAAPACWSPLEVPAGESPAAGLARALGAAGPEGLLLLLGAEPLLAEDSRARWALRRLAQASEGQGACVVLARELPHPELADLAAQGRMQPPGREELDGLLAAETPGVAAGARAPLIEALLGLELRDARHALRGALAAGETPAPQALVEAILDEKEARVRQVGVLELVRSESALERLGGLESVKSWLLQRKQLFTPEAVSQGLPTPAGILIMGVSGCGKSSIAKACSALWEVPLFRLDLNLVFSGLHGSPEASFHRALDVVERAAPAVLWIDELENGIGRAASGDQSHLFSAFLTWLQEKPPLVFVAATANRVDLLPAELLRKGRFDQVFFCDLPNPRERREIFELHLRRAGVEPGDFDLEFLVHDTEGWTGAEIEQALASARVAAHAGGRAFTTADVSDAASEFVPLARTMQEQVRALREWARHRATPAGRPR